MSDVVTGEAVVVEVRVAQLPSRALALAIDIALQGLAVIGVTMLLGMLAPVTEQAVTAALSILMIALVLLGYPVIVETLSRGRSVGKLALGLRVVGDDGGPERFRQALFRGLAGLIEFWLLFGAPALISSLISEQGKRLGDVFAGTIVISERAPRQDPPPQMPPPLAAWAGTLELSRLPEELAATARQYLSRWHQLSPMVRDEMGARIAAQFASFVSPPPPPHAPAYAYLAAVLAERRRRTEVRLARQMAQSSARYGTPPAGHAGGFPGYAYGPAGGFPGYAYGPAGGFPGYAHGPAGGFPGHAYGPAGAPWPGSGHDGGRPAPSWPPVGVQPPPPAGPPVPLPPPPTGPAVPLPPPALAGPSGTARPTPGGFTAPA
ncbi:RDD family protein [Sphaerisporangium sp. TRM90804]|uniref:RDD family protein n=1 Tax=Sphaerisporangium sp. TRM90804 TaxID=3031113 RepID=UPI00244A0202|nr:RDD family protein [Sphaerisporangium sp. TRM90804]MDH2427847.1 RDD family protein [Sphaerisporangium sp. TRM90804]